MNTPVVLLLFNRPELTKRVFRVIKKAKPKKLFIVCDGARSSKMGEKELVDKVRAIVSKIDWRCTVYRRYSEVNLGCKESVSSGLNWVFSKVDKAIILEDDCLPHPSFFPYCEKLLVKYKHINKISMISGNNFFPNIQLNNSYGFSRHSLIWGWATWKRAWRHYNVVNNKGISKFLRRKEKLRLIMNLTRLKAIENTLMGKIDTWDYIWQYAMLDLDSFCIFPKYNLVKNIGFSNSATHTKHPTFHSKLTIHPFDLAIKHPHIITANREYEESMKKTYNKVFVLFDLIKQFFRL